MYDVSSKKEAWPPRPSAVTRSTTTTSPSQPLEHRDVRSDHVLQDWYESSTIHGILDLTRPPYGRVWKATWIGVMLGFAVVTVFSVNETVREYVENPTIQNYLEQSISQLPFPDMIVCTHERVNATALASEGLSRNVIRVLKDKLQPDGLARLITQRTVGFKRRATDRNLSREYEAFRRRVGNLNYEDVLRRFGVDCDSLIKYCSWNENEPPGTSCCDRATVFMDVTYGKCYRLRTPYTNGFRQQTYPGAGAGVQVGFVGRPSKKNAVRGVLVEFVHPDEAPSFAYHQVPSGVLASVQLSLQETRLINVITRGRTCNEPDPHGEPSNTRDSDGRVHLATFRRSANGCFYSIWSEAINKSCSCTQVPGLVEIPLCEPFDQCLDTKLSEIVDESARMQASQCLPQCTKRVYASAITYSEFDARTFFDQLDDDDDEDEDVDDRRQNYTGAIVEGLTILDIYHPRMEFLRVQEVEVYSIMTLISNIGGSLGLWLGASLMSILQMLFYFIKWLSLWKKK